MAAGLVTLCLACSTPPPRDPSRLTDAQIDARLTELPEAVVVARDWEFVGHFAQIGGGVVAIASGAMALACHMSLGGAPAGRDCTATEVLLLGAGGLWFSGSLLRLWAMDEEKTLEQERVELQTERRERRLPSPAPTTQFGVVPLQGGGVLAVRLHF